jgi:hypothetical protein
MPPSYDEALKLDPTALLAQSTLFVPSTNGTTNSAFSMSSESTSRPSSSTYPSSIIINKLRSSSDKIDEDEKNEPPPYTIAPS